MLCLKFLTDEICKRLAQLRISAMQFSTNIKHKWRDAKEKADSNATPSGKAEEIEPVKQGLGYSDPNTTLFKEADTQDLRTHRLPAYMKHVTEMIRTAELASQQSEVRQLAAT